MKTKKGSVALITGASTGMGKVTALQLAKDGYVVYAGARRVDLMEKELKPKGIHVLNLDVCDDASMQAAVKKIMDEQGRIDVLMNNAGYGSYGTVENVSMEEARRQIEVNVFGLARLTQLVIPHMRKQKFGKIINISSIGGKGVSPFGAWYYASKYAVEALSDCLRLELKPFGIDVIIIEPGVIKTEWMDIATKSLMKFEENTVYFPYVKRVVEVFKKFEGRGSEPKVVSDVISKALKSNNPKTRYVVGYSAKMFLFSKKILPDKAFDALALWMMKPRKK